MPRFKTRKLLLGCVIFGAGAIISSQASATPILLLDFKAPDYNATTGTWIDSSGNGDAATAPAGSFPTLATNQTPNGSSAVAFNGSQFLNLSAPVPENATTPGFTIFAFEESSGDGTSKTIISSGASGTGLEYRIGGDMHGEVQELLRQGQANLGQSSTALGTTFHSINVAANGSGATFRTDGLDDGTAAGSGFSNSPLSQIGNANSNEVFVGAIAEIRVYQGVLALSDIQAVESAFQTSYVTPTPEPAALSLIGLGGMLILRRRRRLMS